MAKIRVKIKVKDKVKVKIKFRFKVKVIFKLKVKVKIITNVNFMVSYYVNQKQYDRTISNKKGKKTVRMITDKARLYSQFH